MSKHSVQITSIYCTAASEPNITDGDEVYLICQADGGIPIRVPAAINSSYNMEAGDEWKFDDRPLVLKFDYEVLVTLFDHDVVFDPNTATYLQSNDFTGGSGSGAKQLQNLDGANYTINYVYLS